LGYTTARWDPTRWSESHNPWCDAANFIVRPTADTTRPVFHFNLMALPIELIHYIAKFLPTESAVALALTNRAMYSILRAAVESANLDAIEHWRLLLLLERDTDLLVACQQCRIHPGPITPLATTPNKVSYIRLLIHPGVSTIACLRKLTGHVPLGVTPALCRLMAKRFVRKQPYAELLTTGARTRKLVLSGFKLFSTTSLRLVRGKRCVREETLIVPFGTEGGLTYDYSIK